MLVGETIGPFTIEKELGSGAMGTVYKARQAKEGGATVPVAIKVISIGLLGNEGAVARFDREAAILKQLRHPHIVRLQAVGKYRKTPFIVMEYVDGESLDKALARRQALAWEDVVQYGKQLCDALQHAHDKGIVHRDLKPSNLMVTREGVLKLTDFGIAKDTDVTALTGANSTIGTAAYMSPEQCRGDKTLGPKSDLYSLGICLYELLTGKKPFVAESTIDMFMKHVGETPVRPRKLAQDLPIWLDNLVMFLLEKDKANRPIDAATVGRMLAEIEQKVQAQQSVGAEVANARRADRPVGAAPLNAADKDAAKSLRGGERKKKRRKPKPRAWLRALPITLGLLVLLGVSGYILFGNVFRRESVEAAYAEAEAKPPGEERVKAVTAFLAAHGTKPDPAVEKARDLFVREQEAVAEAGLLKRHGLKMKTTEGYDAEGYPLALQAIDAEAAGELKRAAGLWASVKERSPQPDPAKLTTEDEVNRCRLGWVADKRLKDITVLAPAALKKLRTEIEDERRSEVFRTPAVGTPDDLAFAAQRLENFGDKPKARAKWDALLKLTARDAEQRAWALNAAERLVAAGETTDKAKDAAARLEMVTEKVTALEVRAKSLEGTDNPGPAKREIRNSCRDLDALYADESDAAFEAVRKRAKALLESIPK